MVSDSITTTDRTVHTIQNRSVFTYSENSAILSSPRWAEGRISNTIEGFVPSAIEGETRRGFEKQYFIGSSHSSS